jgi:hypothetical protein
MLFDAVVLLQIVLNYVLIIGVGGWGGLGFVGAPIATVIAVGSRGRRKHSERRIQTPSWSIS